MVDLSIQLPDGFLDEEIRDGFTVSAEMKKIWAVQLDLYAQLDRICKKHNIVYFADAGTILGAVRHKGFIPWDDDLDFCMLRSEFEKFKKVASDELEYPYFFQIESTDPGSLRGHAQLRNSETTAMMKKKEFGKNLPYNQGIFIDIFVFDNLPDNLEEREKFVKKLNSYIPKYMRYAKLTIDYYPEKTLKGYIKTILHGLLGNGKTNINYFLNNEEAQKYNNIRTDMIAPLMFNPLNKSFYLKREWYDSVVEMPFENVVMPLPSGYLEYLNYHYGNWQIPVKGGTIHGGIFFDPDNTYKKYINR